MLELAHGATAAGHTGMSQKGILTVPEDVRGVEGSGWGLCRVFLRSCRGSGFTVQRLNAGSEFHPEFPRVRSMQPKQFPRFPPKFRALGFRV